MKTKRNVEILLENGIHFTTISKMKPNQIRILVEKFETKEQAQITKKIVNQAQINSTGEVATTGPATVTKSGTQTIVTSPEPIIGATSGEVTEKFQSKAQQGFFWAKCNTSKGVKKKKWCELAKEFSDSTSKKQYKDMPEKTTKKRTEEDYEKYLEEQIFGMIEKHIEPSMTKGELLRTIQEKVDKSENFMLKQPKKNTMFQKNGKMNLPIGRLTSISKEMKEDTKEKEKTKTKPGTKTPTRKNPFKDPNPGVEEQPKANTREKERTKEREKTKTPTRRKGNPFKDPNPGVQEQPKAEEQKNDFMSAIESILNK